MSTKTILWADDDLDDLSLMREILLKNGRHYDIAEVHNGKEALSYLERSHIRNNLPCLIVLDINMPVLDGKQTLSIIKRTEAFQSIPVVVFTTSQSELDKTFCQRLGTEMISKPPNFTSLESIVMRLLQFCSK